MLAFARLAVLVLVTSGLAGCYLMQAAHGQYQVMAKRRAIPVVIADPATSPVLKDRLQAVQGMRAFAVAQLGLPDNDSYRSYADVGRDYVVWNVVAAPAFSVEPRHWCFPISGCVAYRGYFNEKKAQAFAARLSRQGFDTYVAGVAAYSTLGHFADPVLNTMVGWSDVQLAAIVFHELAHQVVYVPGDSKFNEAFATVVEEQGVTRWLDHVGRRSELAAFLLYKRRYFEFSNLLGSTRARLLALYGSALPAEQMQIRKQEIFAQLRERYAAERSGWGAAFDHWFNHDLNNAHLVAIATYQDCVPGLEAVFAQSAGGDLQRFYSQAREFARLQTAERQRLLCGPAARP